MKETPKVPRTSVETLVGPHGADPKAKRPRGRPKGSGGFEVSDQKVLIALADRVVREPATVPTKVFRGFGYAGASEIARLNSKWRERKNELLERARLARDASIDLTMLGHLASAVTTFGLNLEAYLASPVGQTYLREAAKMKTAITDGARAAQARDVLGQQSKDNAEVKPSSASRASELAETQHSGLDEDRAEEMVERASGSAKRFEQRQFQTVDELNAVLDPSDTLNDLPASLKFFAMALFYHELGLQAATHEMGRRQGDDADDTPARMGGVDTADDAPSPISSRNSATNGEPK